MQIKLNNLEVAVGCLFYSILFFYAWVLSFEERTVFDGLSIATDFAWFGFLAYSTSISVLSIVRELTKQGAK